jgi:hypothetical protein
VDFSSSILLLVAAGLAVLLATHRRQSTVQAAEVLADS